MTPNSFEFTVTLPGDARFLGAVRHLATQAADYAQLPSDTGAELAAEVARAAQRSPSLPRRPADRLRSSSPEATKRSR